MTIYKKKLGYPFPFAVMTMGMFILLFGIALLIFSYGFAQFFGLMLMFLAIYMCFLRSEIWIDNENHQVKFVKSLFGLNGVFGNYWSIMLRLPSNIRCFLTKGMIKLAED